MLSDVYTALTYKRPQRPPCLGDFHWSSRLSSIMHETFYNVVSMDGPRAWGDLYLQAAIRIGVRPISQLQVSLRQYTVLHIITWGMQGIQSTT